MLRKHPVSHTWTYTKNISRALHYTYEGIQSMWLEPCSTHMKYATNVNRAIISHTWYHTHHITHIISHTLRETSPTLHTWTYTKNISRALHYTYERIQRISVEPYSTDMHVYKVCDSSLAVHTWSMQQMWIEPLYHTHDITHIISHTPYHTHYVKRVLHYTHERVQRILIKPCNTLMNVHKEAWHYRALPYTHLSGSRALHYTHLCKVCEKSPTPHPQTFTKYVNRALHRTRSCLASSWCRTRELETSTYRPRPAWEWYKSGIHVGSELMLHIEHRTGTGVENPHPRSFLGGYKHKHLQTMWIEPYITHMTTDTWTRHQHTRIHGRKRSDLK